MTEMNCAGSFHPQDAPRTEGGIEERIAATGRRIAALQRQLDGAMEELGHARRRATADLALAARYGHQDLALALLPFRDALEAALAVRTGDAAALREGLVLAGRQLDAALVRRHG
ncbi:nucleotide exchange factor GrpE [Massilia varians]